MIQNNWVSLPRLEYITEENTRRTNYSSISQSTYTAGKCIIYIYLSRLTSTIEEES